MHVQGYTLEEVDEVLFSIVVNGMNMAALQGNNYIQTTIEVEQAILDHAFGFLSN